jgi:cobalt/nickel transport system ATP-binding protein
VALASVLSYEPRVLILDEPSNDLDPRGRRELAGLLARGGLARLVASHDLEFVLRTCTRVLLMTGGRIAADGDAVELLTDRALLERHDLESPLGLDGCSAARLREILERDRDRAQWGTPKT